MWQVTGCPWAVGKTVFYIDRGWASVPSPQRHAEVVLMVSVRDGTAHELSCGPRGSPGFQPGQPSPCSQRFKGQGCVYGGLGECSSQCYTLSSRKTPPSSWHKVGMLIGCAHLGWAGPYKVTFRDERVQEAEDRPARRK